MLLLVCVAACAMVSTRANSSGAPFLAFAGTGEAGTSAAGLLAGASLLTFKSFFLAGAYRSAISCKSDAFWDQGIRSSRYKTSREAFLLQGGEQDQRALGGLGILHGV